MGLRSMLARQRRPGKRKAAGGSDGPPLPKNGLLALAVAASLMLAIPLGYHTFKVLREPARGGTTQNAPALSPRDLRCVVDGDKSRPSVGRPVCDPPEVRFYTELTAQEDHPTGPPGADPATSRDGTGAVLESPYGKPARSGSPPMIPPSFPGTGTADAASRHRTPKRLDGPTLPPSSIVYTVQVGAFIDPGIAQQWASRWKLRGFPVRLRPVARPGTGVIYTLYLGEFSSEKQADELVTHLKEKEGISAFPLVVRK
jgi:cell division septation protein DedD